MPNKFFILKKWFILINFFLLQHLELSNDIVTLTSSPFQTPKLSNFHLLHHHLPLLSFAQAYELELSIVLVVFWLVETFHEDVIHLHAPASGIHNLIHSYFQREIMCEYLLFIVFVILVGKDHSFLETVVIYICNPQFHKFSVGKLLNSNKFWVLNLYCGNFKYQ